MSRNHGIRRHILGIAAVVAVLLVLAWFWPVGEPPARSLIATEPTASVGDPSASEDGDGAATTAPAAAPETSEPEPSTVPPETAGPPSAKPTPAAAGPAAEAYGGPLGTRDRTGSDAIGLTFDDGPSPEWTPKVLDLLRERGVKAVFCVIGAYAEAYPELIADIAREGHTLCSHTWFHEYDLGRWSEEEIRANLRRTNDAIVKAAPGAQVAYFRHPGGQWTDRAVAVAADLGMESLHWAVDPSDWDEAATETEIRDHVLDRTGPGAIVLLHDGGANQRDMYGALRSVLAEFERRGYAYTAL
jgi:peptidoglycan/xylan/chitin deacetylase (PgdA/CDA1 family)